MTKAKKINDKKIENKKVTDKKIKKQKPLFFFKNAYVNYFLHQKSNSYKDIDTLLAHLKESMCLMEAVRQRTIFDMREEGKKSPHRICVFFADNDMQSYFVQLLETFPKTVRKHFYVMEWKNFHKNNLKDIRITLFVGDFPESAYKYFFTKNIFIHNTYHLEVKNHVYHLPVLIDNFRSIIWLLLLIKNVWI